MSTHFTVDRGELVEPRHLALVVSNDWPTDAYTDPYEWEQKRKRRNPVGVAVILSLVCAVVLMGVVGWAAF